MAVLHLLNHSPAESPALTRCLASVAEGDALLLIENAVYAALPGALGPDELEAWQRTKIFVLEPDLDARALSGRVLVDGIERVDFDGFVDLVASFDMSVSWG